MVFPGLTRDFPGHLSPPQPPLTSSRKEKKEKSTWLGFACLKYPLTRHHELNCHSDESFSEDQFAAAATVAVRLVEWRAVIELTSLFFAVSESRILADLSRAHRVLPGNHGYAACLLSHRGSGFSRDRNRERSGFLSPHGLRREM